MPVVSIVTCTYNRAHLIGETIESVLKQTYQDFEYIIVDESSLDNTEEVVKSFHDPRIIYYKIPNTKGRLSKLRNFGMLKSTGKYIAFVDSDDLWLPEKLEMQITAMENEPSIGFSYTDIEIFNKTGVIRQSIYNNRTGTFTGSVFDEYVHNKFVVCATTLVFRRACIETIGLEDESFLSGDFDYSITLASEFDAYAIYAPLVRVRRHDQNTTDRVHLSEMFGYLKTLQKLLDRKSITPSTYSKVKTKIYYTFGMQLTEAHEYKWANYFFMKNILANPLQLKPWARILLNIPKRLFY